MGIFGDCRSNAHLISVLIAHFPRLNRLKMKYLIIVEKAENNYSAYVPDLPGCIAVGDTVTEAEQMIAEAIEFHLESMREDSLIIPQPLISASYVEVK